MQNKPLLTDENKKKTTQAAFQSLWKLWKENQSIGNDPRKWEELVNEAKRICERAADAEDPDFIMDFAIDVLLSLERINKEGATAWK